MDQENNLIQKLKDHMRFEPNVMDDQTLQMYLEYATRYVTSKLGYEEDYLIIMVATVMYDHRTSSIGFREAIQSLEPVFGLEILTHDDN